MLTFNERKRILHRKAVLFGALTTVLASALMVAFIFVAAHFIAKWW